MFEDEFSELQADMVDICNEYSCEAAEKIFIYAANEGMILAHHFYCINNMKIKLRIRFPFLIIMMLGLKRKELNWKAETRILPESTKHKRTEIREQD